MLHCPAFKAEPRGGGSRATARIVNGHVYPLNSVYPYITIEHTVDDILEPETPFGAFIGKGNPRILREDRLCWSSTAPSSNPPVIDIYPGEQQSLDIADIRDGKWIEIPSEKGWSTSQTAEFIVIAQRDGKDTRTSRIFLKPKKYTGTIKIVNKGTKAKEFKIEIDPKRPRPAA